MKYFLFCHYWWIVMAVAGLLIFWIHAGGKDPDLKLTLTVIGFCNIRCVFCSEAKARRTKDVNALFREFNRRYDRMNEKLNKIIDVSSSDQLTEDETKARFDYFNLCGEEYLFFKSGYIDPVAWQAWYNGMKFFYKNRASMHYGSGLQILVSGRFVPPVCSTCFAFYGLLENQHPTRTRLLSCCCASST